MGLILHLAAIFWRNGSSSTSFRGDKAVKHDAFWFIYTSDFKEQLRIKLGQFKKRNFFCKPSGHGNVIRHIMLIGNKFTFWLLDQWSYNQV